MRSALVVATSMPGSDAVEAEAELRSGQGSNQRKRGFPQENDHFAHLPACPRVLDSPLREKPKKEKAETGGQVGKWAAIPPTSHAGNCESAHGSDRPTHPPKKSQRAKRRHGKPSVGSAYHPPQR